jgi:hypothetical protein
MHARGSRQGHSRLRQPAALLAQLLGLSHAHLPCNAVKCTPCGMGVTAARTDGIPVFSPVNNSISYLPVSTSANDCCEWGLGVGAACTVTTNDLLWVDVQQSRLA